MRAMEIVTDIISSLAIFPDDAIQTLRDKKSPIWARILSGLTLLCYTMFIIAIIAITIWIIS